MEGLAHYDDPTAGWPDPEHTTLQQAVAAFAAAAAAQDPHGLHHHHHDHHHDHHHPFVDLGTPNNGPDVSRAPGNVHQQHDSHDSHNITLAGAAAAAGGMSMPLGSLDLSAHPHLPPFPTAAHPHFANSNFSLGTPPQHILPTPSNLSQYSHEQDLAAAAAAAAAQAKKLEKKERKRREKAELKRQAEEQARLTAIASQSNAPTPTNGTPAQSTLPVPSAQRPSSSTQQPDFSLPVAVNSTGRSFAATFDPNDHDDSIVRRGGNGGEEGPITDVNEWLAGSWLKGPALRKVAKEKGIDLSIHLRKGKFTSQEEKLVDDAITDYLAARGYNREHDLTRMLFGEGFMDAGDGEAGVNDGAGGAAGQKTRAKNRERVELVKAIAPNIPGRPLTSINAFIVRKYDPYVRKGPWTAQEDADLLSAYRQYGPSWDKISRIVERNETDCRVRYTNHLQIKDTRKRGVWSPEEEEMLYQTIAAVCKASKIPIDDTPNRPISWSTVVQKMGGQRNALECREKWFDQVLPKLLARQEAGATGLSTPVPEAISSAQVDASAPTATSVEPSTSAIKAPRAAEWTQTDFINLLRRIAEVHGPDLSQGYQRDINFRTLHASTPDLAKFSYKHCYKTFRAYAKRIDGFEAMTLDELLPKLESVVTSKFRAGGPRSGSAPLRRPRVSPTHRAGDGTLSQERVDSDSESDAGASSDSASPRAQQEDEQELLKVEMPTETSADSASHENMIDPALLALDAHENIHESMDGLDATHLGLTDEAAAHAYLADTALTSDNADVERDPHAQDKKRRREDEEESSEKKRSKKDKGKRKAEDFTDATSSVDASSHASAHDFDMDNTDMDGALQFGSPDILTEPADAKDSPFAAEVPVETAEEKKKRKEEKRKRKEERRARKEAKRLSQVQPDSTEILAASTVPDNFEF